jgi:hypothetical protein
MPYLPKQKFEVAKRCKQKFIQYHQMPSIGQKNAPFSMGKGCDGCMHNFKVVVYQVPPSQEMWS